MLEDIAAIEVAALIEMIMDRGVGMAANFGLNSADFGLFLTGSLSSDKTRFNYSSPAGYRLALRAALSHIKANKRCHTESTGHHANILFMTVNTGVATMARPGQKPFDPKQIKTESDYAKEALKDARIAAESGKGKSNRGEELGDTPDAHHSITYQIPGK